MNKELLLFAKQWLRQPRNVGSILPSSKALQRKVATLTCSLMTDHQLLEVGPGTGAFTFALENIALKRSKKFIIVEKCTDFANFLKGKIHQDTILINGCIAELVIDTSSPFVVISSIPFKALTKDTASRIYQKYIDFLSGCGETYIIQYSYGINPPHIPSVFSNILKWHQIESTLYNIPPAKIWSLRILNKSESDFLRKSL